MADGSSSVSTAKKWVPPRARPACGGWGLYNNNKKNAARDGGTASGNWYVVANIELQCGDE
jgi:hypothetical protein